jgi:DNA-binding MarR family transcriptional regulator
MSERFRIERNLQGPPFACRRVPSPGRHRDNERARRALWAVWAKVRARLRRVAGEHGLSLPQAMCLRFLGERGSCMAGDLAAELGATPGNVTAVLDRLEEQDLVVRRRSQEDRRSLRLELTPGGARLVRAFDAEAAAALDEAFGRLRPPELRTLVGLLERMGPPVAETPTKVPLRAPATAASAKARARAVARTRRRAVR